MNIAKDMEFINTSYYLENEISKLLRFLENSERRVSKSFDKLGKLRPYGIQRAYNFKMKNILRILVHIGCGMKFKRLVP